MRGLEKSCTFSTYLLINSNLILSHCPGSISHSHFSFPLNGIILAKVLHAVLDMKVFIICCFFSFLPSVVVSSVQTYISSCLDNWWGSYMTLAPAWTFGFTPAPQQHCWLVDLPQASSDEATPLLRNFCCFIISQTYMSQFLHTGCMPLTFLFCCLSSWACNDI